MPQLPKQIIQKLYKKVDTFCSSIPNCCEAGCANCCHQSIEILHWETPLLIAWIKENLSKKQFEQIVENLQSWYDYFDQESPQKSILKNSDLFIDFHKKLANDRIPCPFLINQKCSIYDARPLVCRLHLMKDNPQKCKENQLRDGIPETYQYKIKLVKNIASQYDTFLVLLPLAVGPSFGINYTKKKIALMPIEIE